MLINDALDMSKIESDRMAFKQEPFDLPQVVNSFSEFWQRSWPNRNQAGRGQGPLNA